MQADFLAADLKNEVAALAELLGDTRVRFRHGETKSASAGSQRPMVSRIDRRHRFQPKPGTGL
jgi:hypothetical protein